VALLARRATWPPQFTDAAVPAHVTLNAIYCFEILVQLLIAERKVEAELPSAPDELGSAIAGLFDGAFGPMYRACDLGTDAPDCQCAACNGDEDEAATPLYRLLLERARDIEAEPVAA